MAKSPVAPIADEDLPPSAVARRMGSVCQLLCGSKTTRVVKIAGINICESCKQLVDVIAKDAGVTADYEAATHNPMFGRPAPKKPKPAADIDHPVPKRRRRRAVETR